ncbi:MAG: response regulator [Pyrinomonadaceae bacterium]|nr:response regulator [Pyrinomonadaceae bacterium]
MSTAMGRARLVKLYTWLVVAAGAGAVLLSVYRLPIARFDLQLGLLALLTVTVTSRIRIGIPRLTSEIGVSDTLIFLILLLYGGEAAVLVATADAVIQTSRYGRKLKTFLFNGAMLACATFLSGEVLRYSFEHVANLHYEVFSGNYLMVLCVMTLVQYFVNTGLAAIHSYLKSDEPLLQTWSKYYLWTSITYVAGASCAAITARFINSLGFFTVLVTAPIISIIYLTYRTYLKNVKTAELQTDQARNHVEELNRYIAQQERIQEQFSQVEKLSALGQLASGVAHDFNNSLASILGRSELMMKHTEDAKMRRGLEIIAKSARDGAKTVKRIQDFARQRSERDFELVDVDQMLLDVSEITRPRWRDGAEAKNVHIQLDLRNHSYAQVSGDVSELRDVLVNVIFNAVHAMPMGGQLTLSADVADGQVTLSVIDTGVGMPAEVRSRVFDPFFTTRGVEGMGLGLAVGYGVIRRHHGTFEVESELGKGSAFHIKLPVAEVSAGTHNNSISGVTATPQRRSNMIRVLVVDDEEEVRNLLKDILEDADCEAVTASQAYDGLRLFDEGGFDAVFTDLGMPGMSGWELARAIRQKNSQVPLAIITGWGEAVSTSDREVAQVDWVLSKPFSMAQIGDIVQEVARRREATLKNTGRLTLVA